MCISRINRHLFKLVRLISSTYIRSFYLFLIVIASSVVAYGLGIDEVAFDLDRDMILAHYDCKTDADDIHAAAAWATLLHDEDYATIQYHVVTGTYGIQDGDYIDIPEYFEELFSGHWSDAHDDFDMALTTTVSKASLILQNDGHIWIAEGGQSDFSYHLIRRLELDYQAIFLKEHIHIIQHSEWNENMTTKSYLDYLRTKIDYINIPDGNVQGNGSPGFNATKIEHIIQSINHDKVKEIWVNATNTAKLYNGIGNRYLNPTIQDKGLDFSDFSEICHILSLDALDDISEYFRHTNNQHN